MPDNTINMKLDAASLIQQARQVAASLQGIVGSTLQLSDAWIKTNAEQRPIAGQFEFLTQAGQKLTATLGKVKTEIEGVKTKQFTLTGFKVDPQIGQLNKLIATADKFKQKLSEKADANLIKSFVKESDDVQKQALKQLSQIGIATKKAQVEALAETQKAASLQITQETITGFGPTTGAKPQQLARLNTLQNQLASGVAAGGFGKADIAKIQADIAKGTLAIGDAATGRVQGALIGLNQLFKEINSSSQVAGETASNAAGKIFVSWQGVLRLFQTVALRQFFYSIISGAQEAVAQAQKLSVEVGKIQAVGGGTNRGNITNELRSTSEQFGISINQVATDSLGLLQTKFVNSSNSAQFLTEALKLGAATGLTDKQAIDSLATSLQAYGLKASDAGNASAILFNAMQQGKVNASEFANGIGKTGSAAKELGISFEDVVTATAILSQKGIATGDALNGINSIMERLINPSKEMKDLFEKWGVPSGQAAIATSRFSGVLQKLSQELEKGGTARLGEFEKQLKAVRATALLSSEAFNQMKASISNIPAGREGIEKGAGTALGSPGAQLQQEFQKIQNVFTIDFAGKFIEGLAQANVAVGGFANVLNILLTVGKQLTIAFGAYLIVQNAYKVATLSSAIASVTFNAAISVMAGVSAVATGGVAALTTGLRTLLVTLGPIGLAFTALSFAFSSFQKNAEVGIPTIQTQAQKTEIDNYLKSSHDAINEQTKAFDEGLKAQQQKLLGYIASVRSELSKASEDARTKSDNIAKSLLKGFPDIISETKKEIETFQSLQKEATTNIKGSQREERSARDQTERRAFETALKGLENTPFGNAAAGDLSLGFANKLQGQALELFNIGNIEDARSKLKEVDSVLEKLLQKQVDFRTKAANLGVVFSTPLSQTDAAKSLAGNTQLRIDLEQQYQQQQRTRFNQAASAEQGLIRLQKESQQIQNDLQTIESQRADSASRLHLATDATTKSLQAQLESATQLQKLFEASGTVSGRLFYGPQGSVIRESKDAYENLKKIQSEIGTKPEDQNRPENVAKLGEAQERAIAALKNVSATGQLDKSKSADIFLQTEQSITAAKKAFEDFNSAKIDFGGSEESLSRLKSIVEGLPTTYKSAFDNAAESIKSSVKDINSALDDLESRLPNIGKIRGELQLTPAAARQEAASGGGGDFGFAMGGLVNYFASGGYAEGTDTVHARLTPGEFVVNKSSTEKFLPQLVAMNSVRGYSEGGTVSNNSVTFGDMNFHVKGDGKESTARDIVKVIRRELRRGTASLD